MDVLLENVQALELPICQQALVVVLKASSSCMLRFDKQWWKAPQTLAYPHQQFPKVTLKRFHCCFP